MSDSTLRGSNFTHKKKLSTILSRNLRNKPSFLVESSRSFFSNGSYETILSQNSESFHNHLFASTNMCPNNLFIKKNSKTEMITVKSVISGPHIKCTLAWVPKFSSHNYCKSNLFSGNLFIKRTRTPK